MSRPGAAAGVAAMLAGMIEDSAVADVRGGLTEDGHRG
jgi:hypothetical protein